jgi:hypothetical protein
MARSSYDRLRVVGHSLDQELAQEIEVRVTPEGISTRWRIPPSASEERSKSWAELDLLVDDARRKRQHPRGQMAGRWSPALRALTQEVEGKGVELLLVRSLAGGLQVYGEQSGQPYTQWFTVDRLLDWNNTERTRRVIDLLRPGAHSRWPKLPSWLRGVKPRQH